MHAMTDEFVLGMYADNVRAAHEGLFAQELVWGTITYGYRPRVVPGTPTRRKRARSKYEIDPVTAKWVRKVFTWYIRDGLSLAAIIRRLNDENAPLGPKAVSGRWTRLAVIKLLSNPRYRGCWEYGRSKNVWQSKKDYSRQVPREQPLRQAQFEDLRLVSDEQWYQAQKRLAEDSGASGRHPRDGDRKSRPRLLNGLFFCQEHGRRLYVGGAHGHMMFCPVCQGLPAEKRALYSLLNRKLALRLTCEKLAQLIRPNTALVQEVMAACEQEILRAQQPNPAQLSEARALHEKLSRQVKFILDNLGDSEEDRQEAETTLRRVRAERARVAALAAQLEEAARRPAVMPTAEEIEELLTHLGEILASAGVSETEEEVGAVRQVVKLLTGGRIELVQQGERRSHGGWLQGRFRLRVLPYLVNECTGQVTEDTDGGPEITIDYRTPTSAESWAEKVKALYDQGLLIKAIADQLGINRNLARLALACWSEKHGQPLPDGRSRRSTLDQQYLMLPLYQDIADRVMELYNQGEPLGNIATALNCDPNTVTKAVAYWHEIRGLPVPDGRTRRKSLSHPTSADPQKQDGEIAST
jgi:DNA-binding NarL/FixJ family response regulator